MLLFIKSRKICSSIFYIVSIFINEIQSRLVKAVSINCVVYIVDTYHVLISIYSACKDTQFVEISKCFWRKYVVKMCHGHLSK